MIPGVEFGPTGQAVVNLPKGQVIIVKEGDNRYGFMDMRPSDDGDGYMSQFDQWGVDLATACCIAYALLHPEEMTDDYSDGNSAGTP